MTKCYLVIEMKKKKQYRLMMMMLVYTSLYTHNDEPFWLDHRFFFYNAFLL